MKVLIIRLSAMGDIVHTLPAAALLKQRLPNLELTWLVEPAGIPLLEDNPGVDRVIAFPKRKWLQQLRTVSRLGATAAEASGFVSELRKLEFDAAIDFQGLLKSSVLGFISGAPRRFGFKGTREGAEKLLTHALDVGDYFANDVHVVNHNLRLADYVCQVLSGEPSDTGNVGANSSSYIYESVSFPLPEPPQMVLENVHHMLDGAFGSSRSSEPGGRLAFIPGTTWVTKIWDADNWVELAKLCQNKTKVPILLLGGPSELEMNEYIASKLGDGVLNLTGKTGILDLIAIFQQLDTVVGADTGPLHLAAAVSKPGVLGVFGSTPWRRNGPYGEHCRAVSLELDCQPCFKKVCPLGTLACLKQLSPEKVFEQVLF